MESLFRIKLQIPIVQPKLASRTRIDHELNDGLRGKLTQVIAPAGFGKTTAVAKWLGQVIWPVAWFSIDKFDNSEKRFWNYIIAALNPIMPGLEDRYSQYFHTGNNITIESIVTTLIDELFRYKNDFILVMDDYHLIEETSIHESLDLLIKYLPENVHLVIISRSKSPFGSVRLQTVGQIKEIKISDLQFTTDEIADFCQVKGIPFSTEDVQVIESRTTGWAAGLYLLLDSVGKNMGNLTKLHSGSHFANRRIDSYLTEEVMDHWGEEEKIFMLKTSILPSLSGPLCDALTGRTDGRERNAGKAC